MTNATAMARVARLTVTGRGADREREALAAWLRGNPVLGRGWPVSTAAPAPVAGHMGGGTADALEVVLTGGLGAAQLIIAVLTWRQGRATAGCSGLHVCVDCGETRVEISDLPAEPPSNDGQ
ncbi:hypothetical protein ACFQFC_09770 [Amorphoplanes digitatis]|uniref:Uncharacterized protein n=1 Tax=Actinoplanes digitatis TaxID=1868 RepID=A0A7W7MRP5_9ACTN|nr:hypothetical protein [Actinoplanes digitatis]MBB4764483.1 hypothetical protein [Actinoplanes digitatis]BFE73943.1 hypothetical protein GCM10020092_072440 [Actinoplanes digitatis]GID94030.1 hypothetical protein Adi01nite_34420 [Actinoplanes digitatis]